MKEISVRMKDKGRERFTYQMDNATEVVSAKTYPMEMECMSVWMAG